MSLLTMAGYNIADRDVNNKTARDIAAEKGIQENVDAIGNYVHRIFEFQNFSAYDESVDYGVYMYLSQNRCILKWKLPVYDFPNFGTL